MSKKTDNHCERCHNPVLCDAPHNFVCENPTWIEDLLNDSALWKSIDDDAFPEPISHELLRLRSIFEQHQVFAMVFQIKDVGEVLMKFPVLCSAAYLKNDVITKKLIKKPLSLGDWQGIASELLKHSQHLQLLLTHHPTNILPQGHALLSYNSTEESQPTIITGEASVSLPFIEICECKGSDLIALNKIFSNFVQISISFNDSEEKNNSSHNHSYIFGNILQRPIKRIIK